MVKKVSKKSKHARSRISQADSKKLVKLYTEHQKNWRPLFRSEEFKEMNYDQEQVKQHIRYLTRKALSKSTRGIY
jgi:hypothetical protein